MRIWYAVGFDSHEYMITSLPLHEADTAMHKITKGLLLNRQALKYSMSI